MTRLHRLFVALSLASLIGLAGCDVPPPVSAPTSPTPRPTSPEPVVAPQTEVSREMSTHLARVQANLLVQGLLRVDGGGPDVPFSKRNLVDNFVRIALFDEYTNTGGKIVARETESRLRRWEQPIRMKVEFGPSVPLAQRAKDRAKVASYVKRLSHLTGVPIRLTNVNANYNVLILNENERLAAGPRLQNLAPGIGNASLQAVTNMSRSTLCLVLAYSDNTNSATYAKAVAVIRGEHPDLMRLSCFHEELAQGLGLANDSPAARPSIFNDDEEFGLLTHHDELLLQILYDRRLQAGMTQQQARPIIETIAAELLEGSS